jgi:hypothetical protein
MWRDEDSGPSFLEVNRMDDNVKEILIEFIDYYNAIGTKEDPGIGTFEALAKRASRVLEVHAKGGRLKSADVDPYSFDVVGDGRIYKHEDEL